MTARARDVLGEALAAACSDRELLARLGGPLGAAARTAADELAHERDPRALRAAWAAAARAPVPPGLRGIEATWIDAALAEPGLGERTRQAFAAAETPVDVWLVRRACAALPPMVAVDAALARPRSLAEAVQLSAPALRAWLDEIGADQLAFAVGAAAARAMSPHLRAVAERIAQPPRAGELGDRRAAIARAQLPIDEVALARLGARALAAHVHPLARLQLVHRLPRAVGLVVGAELAAFAHAPVAHAPTWRALAAP